jgi:hypothetical protein
MSNDDSSKDSDFAVNTENDTAHVDFQPPSPESGPVIKPAQPQGPVCEPVEHQGFFMPTYTNSCDPQNNNGLEEQPDEDKSNKTEAEVLAEGEAVP